jgi:hypothetical protein
MSFTSSRLTAGAGTFFVGDAAVHNFTKPYQSVVVTEANTVISVLNGVDEKGVPKDWKVELGLGAGPSLGLGMLVSVPDNCLITQIQLGSGSVSLG